MADKPTLQPTLKGGTIPGTNLPRSEPSEFDKFVGANIDKAVIGTPSGVDGVNPIGKTGLPAPANVLELPQNVTPAQAAQLQAAFAAIVNGQTITTTTQSPVNQVAGSPVTPPVNPNAIVPESQNRMWTPYQAFTPQSRLSDMERSVAPGATNPTSIIPNARVDVKLNPKEGCSPVLVDTYTLLKNLLDGRWLIPGCQYKPTIESLVLRLQNEIEG